MKILCKLLGHSYILIKDTNATLEWDDHIPHTHECQENITCWFFCTRCKNTNAINFKLNNWKVGTKEITTK